MGILPGMIFGFIAWFVFKYGLGGLFSVDQNERAVVTTFGRAPRKGDSTTLDDPISEKLQAHEKERFTYPQLEVLPPGGPYFCMPWQRVYKVPIATQTVNMAFDPENASANRQGTQLDAVTKDQLNIGLTGQLRYRVSDRNLYAYLFAVKNPIAHVMGFFISILRERIANFEAPAGSPAVGDSSVQGISINDLRKNLRDINESMEKECATSAARYGIVLDASLITGIDPPHEVESALAAINTAHNQVSSDISLAQAAADQKIVQSRRAVEIETLKAQAESEPVTQLGDQLRELKKSGPGVLPAYLRHVRRSLYDRAASVVLEMKK
jgi:regulator of protease activity HflC (stomatin/prohibitin superfamily)